MDSIVTKIINVDEFARQLGISRSLAYQAVELGQVPHIRIGRRILIPSDAAQRMLDRSDGGAS